MDTADLGWLSNLWYSGLIGTSGEEGNEFMNTAYPTDYNVPVVEEATEQLQKMLENYTTSDAAGGKYDGNTFLSWRSCNVTKRSVDDSRFQQHRESTGRIL